MPLPRRVIIREDGPREGFQMLSHTVPTDKKRTLIEMLAKAGSPSIEVTSFVRPDRVPQLADAEELCRALTSVPGVRFRALYLNERGLERALSIPSLQPEGYVLIAVSEAFARSNTNTTVAEQLAGIPRWIDRFRAHSLRFERIMLSTAFGYSAEGRFAPVRACAVADEAVKIAQRESMLPEEVTFADTTGYANPSAVRELITLFRAAWPQIAIGLHLHDTRGTGMANVYAGLLEGVDRFDCSVGGLGGCPFAMNAAGNVPTEDVAFLCEELGVETGIDLAAYLECARFAEQLAERPLPGKLRRGGLITGPTTSS